MRPALQRLLSRPSSLDLLRLLVGIPPWTHRTWVSQTRSPPLKPRRLSTYNQTVKVKDSNQLSAIRADGTGDRLDISRRKGERLHMLDTCEQKRKTHKHPSSIDSSKAPNCLSNSPYLNETSNIPQLMGLDLKSVVDELQKLQLSSLSGEPTRDKAKHENTKQLWGYIEFRLLHSDSASESTGDIWSCIRSRGLHLPVDGASSIGKGSLADNIWVPIVELGFKNPETLKNICQYANGIYDATGKKWSKLYCYVIQHMLLNGRGSEAVYWHDILSRRYLPGPASFQRLMRNVIISKRGDHSALKEIYIRNSYRTTYSKVIPPLLESQEFYKAFDWHMFLQYHRDLPLHADTVEPLIQYFSVFDPDTAKGISNGLIASGSPLAPAFTKRMRENANNSRNMISIMSGEAREEAARKLTSDLWVARWFATKWVTLDIAINTAHALKVDTIGPLALQSIALREPKAVDITCRISQLKQHGISIGRSAYSKALVSFAKRGQQDLLQALLESDQHPESFEDRSLQENLLIAHAQTGNWNQHQLVLAVQLAGAVDPVMEEYNMQLRKYALQRDQAAIVKVLESMRMQRIAVEVVTIRFILRSILRPRCRGRMPDESAPGYVRQDIDLAISILKNIMEYNSFVPSTAWREVTRRLGMVGRISDLEGLCLWLADRYSIDSNGHTGLSGTSSRLLAHRPQLLTNHPLHPLRLLFSDVRQRSIVEWGFIRGLMSYAASVDSDSGLVATITSEDQKAQALKQMTQGIRFLKELQKRGVYIKESSVRRAIYVRLVILYGNGASTRHHNRKWRSYNPLTFHEIVRGAEEMWGKPLFPNMKTLRAMVENGRGKTKASSQLLRAGLDITDTMGDIDSRMCRRQGRYKIQ